MLTAARVLLLSAIILTSCHTAKRAAVTTFRVIDTPARFVRDRIDPPQTTTSTTTTTTSDVVNPGRPVTAAPQTRNTTPRTARDAAASTAPRSSTPRPSRTETASTSTPANPSPAPSRAPTTSTTTEFPTARPVPGKPGFVYSIDPKGGMVDVTGYKSGDKAKDPYTHQIFIVP